MRVTRESLLRIAKETAQERAYNDHDILAAYLTGSLLTPDPMLGGTADIEKDVTLGPDRDTLVQESWTAVGGDTVLWVAMGASVLASFPLSVNWLPELDYIPDQRLMQDQPYLLRLTARDKGGEALNWTEDCPLFKFNRTNGTGAEISFRPTNDDVGVFFANFTVTDPKGCVDSQKVRFSVENLNDPPALERIPDLVAYQDSRFNYRVNASDPDQKWGDTTWVSTATAGRKTLTASSWKEETSRA